MVDVRGAPPRATALGKRLGRRGGRGARHQTYHPRPGGAAREVHAARRPGRSSTPGGPARVSISPADLLHSSDADPLALVDAADPAIAARSPLQLFWRRLRRDRVSMVAFGVILLIAVLASL